MPERIVYSYVLIEIGLVEISKFISRIIKTTLLPVRVKQALLKRVVHHAEVVWLVIKLVVAPVMQSKVMSQLMHESTRLLHERAGRRIPQSECDHQIGTWQSSR